MKTLYNVSIGTIALHDGKTKLTPGQELAVSDKQAECASVLDAKDKGWITVTDVAEAVTEALVEQLVVEPVVESEPKPVSTKKAAKS